MLTIKAFVVVVVASFVFAGGPACGCDFRPANSIPANQAEDELKVIAEGSISPITKPFVAVVRDGVTYTALRGLASNLPALSDDFFQSNTVIAAFLGQRNTTGYSVAISREPNGQIRVAEKSPPKNAMVGQMITSPFKLVSVSTKGTSAMVLSLDERFRQAAQLYRVRTATFQVSGGIAGQQEILRLEGKIQINRIGNLITAGVAVVANGTSRERALRDCGTGLLADNEFTIDKLSHGSLLDPPSSNLRVHGRLNANADLWLDLDSGPAPVPDGYSGKGTIEADKVAPPATKFYR